MWLMLSDCVLPQTLWWRVATRQNGVGSHGAAVVGMDHVGFEGAVDVAESSAYLFDSRCAGLPVKAKFCCARGGIAHEVTPSPRIVRSFSRAR